MKDESKLFWFKYYLKNSKCPTYLKIKNDSRTDKNIMHNHSCNEKECAKIIIKTNLKISVKEINNVYNLSITKAYITEITKKIYRIFQYIPQ